MNNAEFICCQVRWLAEKDQITRMQLVEIVEAVLTPYINEDEPKHFEQASQKLHRLVAVSDPPGPEGEDDGVWLSRPKR